MAQTHTQRPADEPEQVLFQQEWRIYRKFVDNNYFFHREVYGRLRQILVEEAAQPFRFLDVACGDASATVAALAGTRVAHYRGIDLSQAALDLARPALEALGCPVTLECGDFTEALRGQPEPVDVAWIGLSLHHLGTPEKLALMRQVRGILADRGLFLIWEPTSRDGEGREGWLDRFEQLHRPAWTALTPAEVTAMINHTRAADFPETASRWQALGREAGFSDVREEFVAPIDFLRMYSFRA